MTDPSTSTKSHSPPPPVGQMATELLAPPPAALSMAALADTRPSAGGPRPERDFHGLKVHGMLGEGGMGAAFLASHKVLRVPLVIKTFKSAAPSQIFREAHLAARVSSPHVVSALDAVRRTVTKRPGADLTPRRMSTPFDNRVMGRPRGTSRSGVVG